MGISKSRLNDLFPTTDVTMSDSRYILSKICALGMARACHVRDWRLIQTCRNDFALYTEICRRGMLVYAPPPPSANYLNDTLVDSSKGS